MNVFVLDYDPIQAAKYHCDQHVIKMILESAQILSTVCRKNGLDCGYKQTHSNHPCVLWAGESLANWMWIYALAEGLNTEYRFRWQKDKDHKSIEVIRSLQIPELPMIEETDFVLAMPDKYKNDDAIKSYRDYYIGDKSRFAKWTKREVPLWFSEEE